MAFAHQVGGHANTILASPLSASTLIKPSSPRELAFYTRLAPSLDPTLVGEWTPAFYGTLKLAGKVAPEGGVAPLDTQDVEPEVRAVHRPRRRCSLSSLLPPPSSSR